MTKYRSEQPGRYVTVEEPGRVPYRTWQPDPLPARADLKPERLADFIVRYEQHDQQLTPPERWDSLLAGRAECFASCAIENIRSDPARLARMWPLTLRGRPLPSLRTVPTAQRPYALQTRQMVGLWQAMTSPDAADDAGNRRDHQLIEPDWHRTVVYGNPGEYRTHRVWIGGSTPATAAFVPPHWEGVPELVDDLYRWISRQLSEQRLPATLTAAVAHAQFETVHPYSDGNGRAGRLLIRRIHQTARIGPPPISAAMWADRPGYYQALNLWRQPDGAERWLDWYSQQLETAIRLTDRLTSQATRIQNRLNQQIQAAPMRPAAAETVRRIVETLPEQPVFTAASAADATGRSDWTIRDSLRRIPNIVAEPLTSSGQRPAVWWNRNMWSLTTPDSLLHTAARLNPSR